MKHFIICFTLLFFYGCTGHECCSHTKHESEKNTYYNSLDTESQEKYNKCESENYSLAISRCNPGYFSDTITKRCVDRMLFYMCKGRL